MRNFIQDNGEDLGTSLEISDILNRNEEMEMRRFASDEQDDDDESDDSQESKQDRFVQEYDPDQFAGLHPNHWGHARARLSYGRDNAALQYFS